jgi:alkylated DNA repair dioxygenase AlkB
MIVNSYRAGEGIKPHVDLLQFEDGIAIFSLISSAVMYFTPRAQPGACSSGSAEHEPAERDRNGCHGVLLNPGDLLLLHGPARYDWQHGIDSVLREDWQGETIQRGDRVSVTLRKMPPLHELKVR